MPPEPARDPLRDFVPSGNSRLDAQLRFTAVIDRMTAVKRRTRVLDMSRAENDAEHSWHIAVMAMLFAEYAVEKPDVAHAIELLLVHDLVEVYAGDTFAFDTAGNRDKAARENASADRLYAILPPDQGAWLRTLWREFEEMSTVASKYANCLDRIQPFYHNTLTEGFTWRRFGPVTLAQVRQRIAIVREFMPALHAWAERCIDQAVSQGWLPPE
jgi:putative hydrolase of HD superfamily